MTDNEIIKALECCGMDYCNDCPLANDDIEEIGCDVNICFTALDLINRQKAEIEKYEKENDSNFDKWKLLDERTKQRYAEMYQEAKDAVRAKAINETLKKTKDKLFSYYECVNEQTNKSNYDGNTLMAYEVANMIEDCIESVAEEMTEERP